MITSLKDRLAHFFHELNAFDWDRIGGKALKLDCMWARVIYGTVVEEYIALEFYRKNHRERKKFLTGAGQARLLIRLLKKTTQEQRDRIFDKLQFDRFFGEFIHREYLDVSNSSDDEVIAFIQKHGAVLAKPLSETHGNGIFRIESSHVAPSDLAKIREKKYLLEEIIVQHHEMARPNPTSVNTVRIATALDRDGHAHIIGACLRCGARGSFVDNTHSGGVAYPINTEHGVVIAPGKNRSTFEDLIIHPGSDVVMPGFCIPNWDIIVDTVKRAAMKIPEFPYLGWDIAVTEDGVEIIEGNWAHSVVGIQSDQIGKRQLVDQVLFGKPTSEK